MKSKNSIVVGLLLFIVGILIVTGGTYLNRKAQYDQHEPTEHVKITSPETDARDTDIENSPSSRDDNVSPNRSGLSIEETIKNPEPGNGVDDKNMLLAAKTRITDKYWKYFEDTNLPPETIVAVEKRLVGDEYARLLLEKRLGRGEITLEQFRQETSVPIEEKLGLLLGNLLSTAQLDVLLAKVHEERRKSIAELINSQLPNLNEKNRNLLIEAFLTELDLERAGMTQMAMANMSNEDRLYRIQIFTDNIRVRLQGAAMSSDQRLIMEEFLKEYVANFEIMFDHDE